MSEKKKQGLTLTLGGAACWLSIAAMVIAMMHYGYSCHGCGDCRGPTEQTHTHEVE